MEGESLTEMKRGSGGGNTNWKTLSDVKTEHLGHGDKVHTRGRLCFDMLKHLRYGNSRHIVIQR